MRSTIICIIVVLAGFQAALAADKPPEDASYTHRNVKCSCSCREEIVPTITPCNGTERVAHDGSTTCESVYLSGPDTTTKARETCLFFDKGKDTLRRCSYVMLLSNTQQCLCDKVLPVVGSGQHVRTQEDCDLCRCSPQERDQALIEGVVITFLILLVTLIIYAGCQVFSDMQRSHTHTPLSVRGSALRTRLVGGDQSHERTFGPSTGSRKQSVGW